MIAIICAAVLVVTAVGGFTAYRFLRPTGPSSAAGTPAATVPGDTPVAAHTAVPPRVDTAQPVANPMLQVRSNPPETKPPAPAASLAAPAPTGEAVATSTAEPDGNEAENRSAPNRSAAQQDEASAQASAEAAVPRPEPKHSKPPAPARAAAPDMSGIALNLVRKGEADFERQDYSAAITNAKAALQISPNLARASRLLQEAQRGQQQAMNSISIQ